MPDRVLQKHYCVAALQHRLSYNGTMSLPASQHSDTPTVPPRNAADPRRAPARFHRADLVMVTLLSTIVLAAGCGGGSSAKPAVNPANRALAWVNCMRTHGEPHLPDPTINGRNVSIDIHPGDGVDPHSAQFTAAFKACKHLTGGNLSAARGNTITPADQADYLRAVVCMRSHGFPKFPEPAFQNNNVTFRSTTPIDTNSAQFQRALAICDKLIPAGLPYSGHNPGA
jgi:hypothetical protein